MGEFILVVVSFVASQTSFGDVNPHTNKRISSIEKSYVVTMQEFSSSGKCEQARKIVAPFVEKTECIPK